MKLFLAMFEDAEGVGVTVHKSERGAVEYLRGGVRDHYETNRLGVTTGSIDAATERLA
jgi:hypothetical protein